MVKRKVYRRYRKSLRMKQKSFRYIIQNRQAAKFGLITPGRQTINFYKKGGGVPKGRTKLLISYLMSRLRS